MSKRRRRGIDVWIGLNWHTTAHHGTPWSQLPGTSCGFITSIIGWCPPVISWFINPLTIVISAINHSYGAPPCIIRFICLLGFGCPNPTPPQGLPPSTAKTAVLGAECGGDLRQVPLVVMTVRVLFFLAGYMGYNVGRTIIKQPYLDGLYHIYIYSIYILWYGEIGDGLLVTVLSTWNQIISEKIETNM